MEEANSDIASPTVKMKIEAIIQDQMAPEGPAVRAAPRSEDTEGKIPMME